MTSLIYPITFTSVRPTNTDGVALDNWNPQNTLIWIFLFQFQSGGLGTAVRAQILSWNVNWALWSTLCGLIMEDSQYQSVTGRATLPGQSTAWSRGPSGWSTPGNGRATHLVASPFNPLGTWILHFKIFSKNRIIMLLKICRFSVLTLIVMALI